MTDIVVKINNLMKELLSNILKWGGECGPCPDFASFTLTFALQLRKNHGKSSVRVTKGPSAV